MMLMTMSRIRGLAREVDARSKFKVDILRLANCESSTKDHIDVTVRKCLLLTLEIAWQSVYRTAGSCVSAIVRKSSLQSD